MLKQLKVLIITLTLLALAMPFCGCISPDVEDITKLSPQDVASLYWRSLDKGDYDKAFNLTYNNENMLKDKWVEERVASYGPNGTYIQVHNFTVLSVTQLGPETFTGNFSEIRSVAMQMNITYMGRYNTGIVQAVIVMTDNGWKMFGSY